MQVQAQVRAQVGTEVRKVQGLTLPLAGLGFKD
jgi:hypothetical protein